MNNVIYFAASGALAIGVLAGIAMMGRVTTAVRGNALSAVCMAAAIILTMSHYRILSLLELWLCVGIGLAAGLLWAARIKMIDMPQVVALLNVSAARRRRWWRS